MTDDDEAAGSSPGADHPGCAAYAAARATSAVGARRLGAITRRFTITNRGDDQEVDFLSQGLTDELTISLGRFLFKVVARSSAVRFRGEGLDVRKIGRDLKVHMALKGSVRKYGPTVTAGGATE